MSYVEPKVEILKATRDGEVSTLVIQFFEPASAPEAPAGIYTDPNSGTEQFQLHRVTKKEGLVFTFETFHSEQPLPEERVQYYYRGWWMTQAMDAVLDTNEIWNKQKYPDNGDHDHCLFTWETIASYSDCKEGYFSKKYGWVTCEAYDAYIAGDVYKLRELKIA